MDKDTKSFFMTLAGITAAVFAVAFFASKAPSNPAPTSTTEKVLIPLFARVVQDIPYKHVPGLMTLTEELDDTQSVTLSGVVGGYKYTVKEDDVQSAIISFNELVHC